MKPILLAELRKLIFLRSTWILLAGSAIFAGLSVFAAIETVNSTLNMGLSNTSTPQGINAVFANTIGGYLFALIIGILIMTSEFRHGTVVNTFLVTPKRFRILLAKILMGGIAGLLFQLISYLFALACAFSALHCINGHAPVSSTLLISTFRAAMLSGAVLGMVGVSMGALVRNQIVAVSGVIFWTLVVEALVVAFASSLGKFFPAGAIIGILDVDIGKNDFNFTTNEYLSPFGSTLVLLSYATVFSFLAMKFTLKRDLD